MAGARIKTARGARACEALLLRDVETLLQAAIDDPKLLGRPVRVVVPSRSLREHLGALFVRHFGRPLAGVALHTLHGLAAEAVDRAGRVTPRGQQLFPILVRQQARREPTLQRELEDLADGYAAVIGSVADLLDAGFDPPHAAALEEVLDQESDPRAQIVRVRALLRVAAGVAGAMDQTGGGRASTLWQLARDQLERDPDRHLPARAVLIHGFADATGVATDFIEALLRYRDGWIYLDRPADPAAPDEAEAGADFTRRFRERLTGAARVEPFTDASAPPRLALLQAPGAHAEVRAVARRIRLLLDEGVRPETIGVVARELAPYVIPLRLHFRRLAIPFSGVGATGPATAIGRRVGAVLDLLRLRLEAPAERWLDALVGSSLSQGIPRRTLRSDVRLALHTLGAARIGDVARLDADSVLTGDGDYPLPIRQGLWGATADDANEDVPRAVRRKLSGSVLRQATDTARALRAGWERWPSQAPAQRHFEELWRLLRERLGWNEEMAGADDVLTALQDLEGEVPGDFGLSYEDFVLLLTHALSRVGHPPIGGHGGGVQVLDVTEARARTFDHLFVLGMNRDVFPRIVLDDPLWPDPLRQAMRTVLPDIPIKGTGFDEERYLFAQMLSAGVNVTLSWQIVDDDGKARSPSPLVERLRLARPDIGCETAPSVFARPSTDDIPSRPPFSEGRDLSRRVPASPPSTLSSPPSGAYRRAPPRVAPVRPAHEHAVLAGLYGTRDDFARLLPIAIRETQRLLPATPPAPAPEPVAMGRLAVLSELDPDPRTACGRARHRILGPYHGFIGPALDAADPRRASLFITTIERGARCPWQVFVERLLRVEPAPDVLDTLPHADPLLLGSAVHRVLERIAGEHVPEPAPDLAEVRHRQPTAVPWPDDLRLTQALREEAERLLHEEGLGLSGLTEVLVRMAQPYLQMARQHDWPDGGSLPQVVGAETTGIVFVADGEGRTRSIRFKADRVDATEHGLRLTDYKTGKPVSEGINEVTRSRNLFHQVTTGERLQAVAYALGAGGASDDGRYLFLKPDIPEVSRQVTVRSSDAPLAERFHRAVRTVLAAWDAGSFFPRFAEPNGRKPFEGCAYCAVAEACLRNDATYRTRLLRWLDDNQTTCGHDDRPTSAQQRALLGLWRLRESTRRWEPEE